MPRIKLICLNIPSKFACIFTLICSTDMKCLCYWTKWCSRILISLRYKFIAQTSIYQKGFRVCGARNSLHFHNIRHSTYCKNFPTCVEPATQLRKFPRCLQVLKMQRSWYYYCWWWRWWNADKLPGCLTIHLALAGSGPNWLIFPFR